MTRSNNLWLHQYCDASQLKIAYTGNRNNNAYRATVRYLRRTDDDDCDEGTIAPADFLPCDQYAFPFVESDRLSHSIWPSITLVVDLPCYQLDDFRARCRIYFRTSRATFIRMLSSLPTQLAAVDTNIIDPDPASSSPSSANRSLIPEKQPSVVVFGPSFQPNVSTHLTQRCPAPGSSRRRRLAS